MGYYRLVFHTDLDKGVGADEGNPIEFHFIRTKSKFFDVAAQFLELKRVIRIHKNGFSIGHQKVIKLTFPFDDTFFATETFEMRLPEIRNIAKIGLGDLT